MKAQALGKLSISSSIFLAVTSMVGGGIFIKAHALNTLSHNHLTPTIFLFLLFLLNIFCFAYVLIRIIPSQTGNMGFMEWSERFCSKRLHSCFCNFIRFFYHPISLILFSVYGVSNMLGRHNTGIISTLFLAFLVVLVLMFINLISFKWSHRIQYILWYIVLIPLILLPLIGLFSGGNSITPKKSVALESKATGLDSLGPWMIIISGLPSVLFIYDGFYSLASLKDRIGSNKVLSLSLISSFVIVTFIYLYVIIGFNVGDPKNADYANFSFFRSRPVLRDIFEICIGCASFLTLNSIVLSNISQLTAMSEAHNFDDLKKFCNMVFYKKRENSEFDMRFSNWIYLMAKTVVWFIFIGGAILFLNRWTPGRALYTVIDSITDIVSVFIFCILVSIVLSSIRGIPKTRENRRFILCAKASSCLTIVALIYLFISYIVGLTGFAGASRMGSAIKLAFLILFLIGSCWEKIALVFGRLFRLKKHMLYRRNNSGSIVILK